MLFAAISENQERIKRSGVVVMSWTCDPSVAVLVSGGECPQAGLGNRVIAF